MIEKESDNQNNPFFMLFKLFENSQVD